jgi:raffinose/stachyose/melibiose transport system substrate-binding protein
MKRTIAKIAFAAPLVLALLGSCGGSDKKAVASKGPIKLNLYIQQSDDKMTQAVEMMKAEFPTMLPGIEVTINAIPGEAQAFENKIRTMIAAGGSGLDVWWERGGSFAVPILQAKGALALDQYLEKEQFWDKAIPSAKVPNEDGKQYAIPFETIFYEIMFYNPAIFKAHGLSAPKTVEDLKKAVQVLKKAGIIPIAVAGKDGWPAAMMVEGFSYPKDPEATKKVVEGSSKFSESSYQQGATVTKQLLELGAFSKNVALDDYSTAEGLFVSGNAAMIANGSWALGDYNTKMNGNVDYFYYPALDPADVPKLGLNVAGGVKKNAGMMVYAGTEHPAEAVKLAIATAEIYNRLEYDKLGNPFIAYRPEKIGCTSSQEFGPAIKRFAEDITKFQFVYGFVQDVMPSAAGTNGVMEATSKFMTNPSSYGVAAYLADMDKAAEEK